jgi:hypothetical protein
MKVGSKFLSDSKLGALDYFLAGIAGMTATYSIGMSLLRPELGWFFVIGIGLGMIASFLIQRSFGEQKWLNVGAHLYFIFAIAAVFYSRQLNTLLPEDGFSERELTVAAVLSWMILFGSWVSWKDSTLLFLAVPSIALFGLVGAFGTFAGSTVAFFIFLLSLATLFARAHGRAMMKQAQDSGYLRLDTIRQGPWRWMAGPEWALASAAVVILISVFGAPILQESVKGVSGLVRIPLPRLPRSRSAPQPLLPGVGAQADSVPVGTGPIDLKDRLLFSAKMDLPRYLRIASYSSYSQGNWNKVAIENGAARRFSMTASALQEQLIESGALSIIPFDIQFEGPALGNLPVPGEAVSFEKPDLFRRLMDGGVAFTGPVPANSRFGGSSAVPGAGKPLRNVPNPLPEFLWRYTLVNDVPARVAQLSDDVAANLSSDYEKAMAIKAEIERRCKYNLNAERAPNRADPVEYFLFGEEKEGYCDLFASAMVLMARWQGIPARYVRGFFPVNGDENGDGWYEITEASAHAWAELYFEGVGWIPFDPTEGAQAVPGSERGSTNDTSPWYTRKWFEWTLNGAIGFSFLAACFVALRGIRRARAAVNWEQIELARTYEMFAGALQKASGQPRRPNQTTTEYLHRVSGALGSLTVQAQEIDAMFVRTLYGPPGDDKPAAGDIREPVRQFKRALREAKRRV